MSLAAMEQTEPAGTTITLVLADDHTVMRNGLRMLLDAEDDFEVLGEAGDVRSAFQAVRNHRPDVLVLDLNMPGGSSIDAIERLAPISPRTSVVVLTMEEDRAFVREALDAGAHDYVLKHAAGRELVRSIRAAVAAAEWLPGTAPEPSEELTVDLTRAALESASWPAGSRRLGISHEAARRLEQAALERLAMEHELDALREAAWVRSDAVLRRAPRASTSIGWS